jgi:hypothetical protein
MIIGIATLLMMLFGIGGTDVFYMDKLEEGVKKYVVDKDRKKECKAILKKQSENVNQFLKQYKMRIKYLKEENLEKATTDEWYENFFMAALEERKVLQLNSIDLRLELQKKINDDEWAKIVEMSEDATRKLEEKELKKEMKKGAESFYERFSELITEEILDSTKKTNIIEGLNEMQIEWLDLVDRIDDIDAVNSSLLTDKNATREQMLASVKDLNQYRLEFNEAYIRFFRILKDNTSDTEYVTLIKEINKFKGN